MSKYMGELTVHEGEDRVISSTADDTTVTLNPSTSTLAATCTPTDGISEGFTVADGSFTKTTTTWQMPLTRANLNGRGGQRLKCEVRRIDAGFETVLVWWFLNVRKAA